MELSSTYADTHNQFYDRADEVVTPPERDGLVARDPEFYMSRLREITTPGQQMKEFVLSVFNPYNDNATHEGLFVRSMALYGLTFGWIVGGLLDSKHLHTEYARQHNASVFDGNYRAKRHRYDTLVLTVARRGMPLAFKSSLMALGAGFIGFGSISFRNRLYYPDWVAGCAALGALSRCWLGTRGVVAGAGFGILGGTIGYAMARASEISSGMSVAELRYQEEMQFAQKRRALRDRLQRQRVEWVKEQSQ